MRFIILLTFVTYAHAVLRGLSSVKPHNQRSLQITTSRSAYWPYRVDGDENKIYVPVTYDDVVSDSRRSFIKSSLEDLSRKVKYIDVIFYDNAAEISSGAYVIYQDKDSGCSAGVGFPGDSRSVMVNLGSGCWTTRTVQHEFMHTLGVFHEHSRSDRDDFIKVLTENIAGGYEYNFYKRTTNDLESPFDFRSIMIYSKRAFSRNGSPTLQKINDTSYDWGTPSSMSTQDIRQLQLMYRCPDGPRNESQFCDPNCPCPEDEGPCYDSTACQDGLVCDTTDNHCKRSNATNPPVSQPISSPTLHPTHYPTVQPSPATPFPTTPLPTGSPTSFPTFGGRYVSTENVGYNQTIVIIILATLVGLPLVCVGILCSVRYCKHDCLIKKNKLRSFDDKIVYKNISRDTGQFNLNRLNQPDMPI